MKILYLQYTNPAGYPPLEHSSRILANQGWRVLFLGTGAQGTSTLEFPPHPRIRVRRLKFCPAGWRQKLHYFYFGFWALGWVLRWRPRWIYASDPLVCPVAWALSFVPGLRVLYHEHDSPGDEDRRTEDGGRRTEDGAPVVRHRASAFVRFTLWARGKLARRAALCVLPNERRVRSFQAQTGASESVRCVWNCPGREEAQAAERIEDGREKLEDGKQKGEERKFVVFYHGSIVPARLPLTVIDALALLPERVVLRVAGYETVGSRGYVERLRARASQLGRGASFEYLGALPARADLLRHCRTAQVGLALMPMDSRDPNEQSMAGASNKPFDYLACGLALLVSDLPDWKGMFVEPGFGLACQPEGAASIARALHWFLEHAAETREMGERGRRRILAQWNYEDQFATVAQRLNGAIPVE